MSILAEDLIAAIDEDDHNRLVRALEAGASPNSRVRPELFRGWRGLTVLHLAVLVPTSRLVPELVNRGAQVTTADSYGRTPLHYAAITGKSKLVDYLLQQGASPHTIDVKGTSPVHVAVITNHVNVLDVFKKAGVNLDTQDDSGNTYLHLAIARGKKEGVRWLLESGVNVLIENNWGRKPVDVARNLGCHPKLIEALSDSNWEEPPALEFCAPNEALQDLFEALLKDNAQDVGAALKNGAWPMAIVPPERIGGWRGTTALHFAARRCSSMVVEALVQGGGNIEAQDESDFVPLHVATRSRKYDIVRYLLCQGANPCVLNKDGKSPVLLAVIIGSVRTMEIFKEFGVDLNMKGNYGNSLLQHALAYGLNVEMIRWLLENKVQVNIRNNYSRTAKDVAVDMGYDPALIKVLGDPMYQGPIPHFKTPASVLLIEGVVSKSVKQVTGAFRLGASPHQKVPPERWFSADQVNILHWAILRSSSEVVEVLIENGSDVNAKTKTGRTPLHYAAKLGKPDMLELLLSKGASPHIQDEDKKTAIVYAIAKGILLDLECFQLESVDLNESISNGNTLLHFALAFGNTHVVKWLLLKKVDLTAKNSLGRTPKNVAEDVGYNKEVIEFLSGTTTEDHVPVITSPRTLDFLEALRNGDVKAVTDHLDAGVSPNTEVPPEQYRNIQFVSTLHLAAQDSSVKLLKCLLDRGANVNAKDAQGWTPLHYAAAAARQNLVGCLLEHGADPMARSYNQCTTPVLLALTASYVSTLRVFLEKGADMKARDNDGNTYLHLALARGTTGVITWLLEEACAEVPRARNKWGRRPVDVARALQYDEATIQLLEVQKSWEFIPHVDKPSSIKLIKAMIKLDESAATKALEEGASANTVVLPESRWFEYDGVTILHLAVMETSLPMVKSLVQRGASVNAQDAMGFTPLHSAVLCERVKLVEFLLSAGASPYLMDEWNKSPILYTVMRGRIDILEAFQRNGVDFNTTNQNGNTYLHIALAHGRLEEVRWLLEAQVDVTAQNLWGRTPRNVALDAHYDEALIRILGEANCPKSLPTFSMSTTMRLIMAVWEDDLSLAAEALKAGASPNAIVPRELMTLEASETTVLHLACRGPSTPLVQLLIERGAHINTKNETGVTPLHDAAENGRLTTVAYLVRKGALADERDGMGRSPVLYAVLRGCTDTLEVLKLGGVDLQARDHNGSTYLHIALAHGRPNVVLWLLKEKVDATVENMWGRSAMDVAHDLGYDDEVVQLLGGTGQQDTMPSFRVPNSLILVNAIIMNDTMRCFEALEAGSPTSIILPKERLATGSGETALHLVVSNGSLQIVEEMLERSTDVNIRDHKGSTPLHNAVLSGNDEIARVLLKNGALSDQIDDQGRSPTWHAVTLGRLEILKALKGNKVDFRARDADDNTYFQLAIIHGQLEVARWLLQETMVDLESQNAWGRTVIDISKDLDYNASLIQILRGSEDFSPEAICSVTSTLVSAIERRDAGAVIRALKLGADPRTVVPLEVSAGQAGVTVLHRAASLSARSTLLLINSGAASSAESHRQENALHHAGLGISEFSVGLLLRAGSSHFAEDVFGNMPIHNATEQRHLNAFLGAKCDINVKDRYGKTPLCHALAFGKTKAILWFLQTLKAKEIEDSVPSPIVFAKQLGYNSEFLHYMKDPSCCRHPPHIKLPLGVSIVSSVRKALVSDVAWLLDHGADANTRIEAGLPPGSSLLHGCVVWNLPCLTTLLLDRGADPHMHNEEQESPIDLARKLNHNHLLKLLGVA